jgi:hypothetical protein
MFGASRAGLYAANPVVAAFTDTYYFGATVGDGNDNQQLIATDADSNMYGMMQTDSSTLIGNRDIYVWKRNSSGTFQWARRLGVSSQSWTTGGIAADSSGNVYCLFDNNSYSSYLFKLDSTGSISLAKTIKGDDASNFTVAFSRSNGIAVTGSKVHIIGYSGNSTYKTNIVTLNSSDLTHSWTRQITAASQAQIFGQVRADSSGNVYAMFGGGGDSHVVKYNSSGTIQWQRNLDYTSQDAVGSVAVDSTGAVYVTGNYSGSGMWFAKIASDAGSVSWTKTITDADVVAGQPQIQVDNNDNVYVSGRTASNLATFIAKFNSSGTLDWRRTITPAQSNMVNLSSAINDYAFYVIAGHNFSATRDSVVMKIPLDGTLTATKSLNSENFVYAANTSIAIATTPVASVSTSSLTTGSDAGSSNTFTSYTTNTTSLTNYLVTL